MKILLDAQLPRSLVPLLQATPKKLLVIASGNIRNPELAQLLLQALPSLKSLFATKGLIELHRTALIIRR